MFKKELEILRTLLRRKFVRIIAAPFGEATGKPPEIAVIEGRGRCRAVGGSLACSEGGCRIGRRHGKSILLEARDERVNDEVPAVNEYE